MKSSITLSEEAVQAVKWLKEQVGGFNLSQAINRMVVQVARTKGWTGILVLLMILCLFGCGYPQSTTAESTTVESTTIETRSDEMALKAQIFYPALSGLRFDGAALSGGLVYFYEPGTTTFRTVYTNRNKTTTAANPYTLDTNGQAEIFLDGVYDIYVTTSTGAPKATWEGYDSTTTSSPFRGALVYGVSALNGSLQFLYEEYDTDAIHSGASDRLVVPDGVTKVRLKAQIYAPGNMANTRILIRKNGSPENYRGEANCIFPQTASSTPITKLLETPVLSVSGGSYFDVYVLSDGAVVTADATGFYWWFTMEIVE